VAYSEDVAEIAKAACAAHAAGKSVFLAGNPSQHFDLVTGGFCGMFVRQCNEAGSGLDPGGWQFAAPSAACMEYHLRAAGKQVTVPNPGDIICIDTGVPESRLNDIDWQRANGNFGHTAIHLGTASHPNDISGSGHLAENTSSLSRGPGTVISSYSQLAGRRLRFYRVLPAYSEPEQTEEVKIIKHSTGELLSTEQMVPHGDHIADHGKLYVEG
jgi:hypothetical protein